MADDHATRVHREWLGYVQPVGLILAPAALVDRGVFPDANVGPLQEQLDELTRRDADAEPLVSDFPQFAQKFLGWRADDLVGAAGGPLLPDTLEATLIDYEERLAPTYAVPAPGEASAWQLLIAVEGENVELDEPRADDGRRWVASPQARFERLLRETNVSAGLLTNGRLFRLIYAPKGETSGYATFDLSVMLEVAGRPILAAFHMLLVAERLFGLPEQNLAALFAESRKYQETVSKELARQVLTALNELLRGLASGGARGAAITKLATDEPDQLYAGLLTALLRLVFTLYAEDRGLFPQNDVWQANYSLSGLFLRLRDDAALYPDTMDDRYGAWAQLLALWRLIHGGGRHAEIALVARRGQLFDPDRFLFLEGRQHAGDPVSVPSVSDGVVWRILQSLMVLDGERLSYRTLDVEQIGSVYQSTMGFTIELTHGSASLAIRPPKQSGAASTVSLDELLVEPAAKRKAWLKARTDRDVTGKAEAAMKVAASTEALDAALSSVVDRRITPKALPAGVPVLQPTQARRRSGSHYTPRTLTAPIVAETLRPILERLGPEASADDILGLRVLDPALGSGAFLVEACRQLAERLTIAWERYGTTPPLPPDEDALLHARRLVAQRCLYGVDRNAMATDLAKLSLWLTTLAREHEFTFLDHAIRHGDALVGLSLAQLEALNWDQESGPSRQFSSEEVRHAIEAATQARRDIQNAPDDANESDMRALLERVDRAVEKARVLADALVTAFFAKDKPAARERERQPVISFLLQPDPVTALRAYRASVGISLSPFHWQLEFPEVFERENSGFDAVLGNPPYAGKNTITAGNPTNYIAWLQTLHPGAHGNADLVAHFFRRAFSLLRDGGALGLIATNTIRQGDTRATGLRWIRQHGGTIYNAIRRFRWPGEAAVVVCVLHILKADSVDGVLLDGRVVPVITAFLFDQGTDEDPYGLGANADGSFNGSYPLTMGFTFDDTDKKGVASPIWRMQELIASEPRNAECIKPYIGGKEVLTDPSHRYHRFIIDFGTRTLLEARQWPDLIDIIEQKVKPARDGDKREVYRNLWWQFAERRPALYLAIRSNQRVLVTAQTASNFAPSFIPNGSVYDQTLVVFALQSSAAFAIIQSLPHDLWAAFFGPTMEDRRRYAPSDAFQTFPFPELWAQNGALRAAGRECFETRAAAMVQRNKGLTVIYNGFHDRDDESPPILELRRLQRFTRSCSTRRLRVARYRRAAVIRDRVVGRRWQGIDSLHMAARSTRRGSCSASCTQCRTA